MNSNSPSPLISIIVPIYNVEAYLPACLDSLRRQTLQDIEIICVNDASPDGSLSVAEAYAQRDSRIIVISHTHNQGLGAARNMGVENATASYILFVDSDDVVSPEMAEKLYTLLVSNNADLSWCNMGSLTEDGSTPKDGDSIPSGIYTMSAVLESPQLYQTMLSVCNKMFKRSMILDVKQPPIVSEDQPFLSVVLGRCNTIAITTDTYYYYRNRQGTLSKPKQHTAESWNAFFYAHKLFFENLPESKTTRKGMYVQCVKRYFSLFWRIRVFRLLEQETWLEQRQSIFAHIQANDIPIKRYSRLLYAFLCFVFARARSPQKERKWVNLGYDLCNYMGRQTSLLKVGYFLFRRLGYVVLYHIECLLDKIEQCFFRLLALCIHKDIWLIGERLDTYQDNGMYFFKYMQQHHPEVSSYYVIDKPHARLVDSANVLLYNSFKHKLCFCAAQVYANAHYDVAYPRSCCTQKRYSFPKHSLNVFLQHGITYSNVNKYYGKNHSDIDVFVCAVPIEQQVAVRDFDYSPSQAVLTGFARFDGLHDIHTQQQILLMPTWRRMMQGFSVVDFLHSDYYRTLHSLLSSAAVAEWLTKYNMRLIFAPHYEMSAFLHTFSDIETDAVQIVDTSKCSVQQLLKDSQILITDVSSVQFDFAYMQKPLLYYQWDYDSIVANHLWKGYFDFEQNGFGTICRTLDEVLCELDKIAANDWCMDEHFRQRVNAFFCFRDTDNCQRIYNAIKKLL